MSSRGFCHDLIRLSGSTRLSSNTPNRGDGTQRGSGARQADDGSWPPIWSWGLAYPELWPQAAAEWAGEQTVMTLSALTAWGRVA